jgi:hypothetical protein
MQQTETVFEQDKTPVQVLMAAEQAFPKQEGAQQFINNLKESLTVGISETNFGEFFDLSVYYHSDYIEQSSREFIIKILSKEDRPDNFVTCVLKEQYRKTPAWLRYGISAAVFF